MVKDNKKISKLVTPPVDIAETPSVSAPVPVPVPVVGSAVASVVGPVVAPDLVATTLDLDLATPPKYPSVFSTKYVVPPLPVVDLSIYNDDLVHHEASVLSEVKIPVPQAPPPPPVLTAPPATPASAPPVAEVPVVIDDMNNICVPFPKSKTVDDIVFCCTM